MVAGRREDGIIARAEREGQDARTAHRDAVVALAANDRVIRHALDRDCFDTFRIDSAEIDRPAAFCVKDAERVVRRRRVRAANGIAAVRVEAGSLSARFHRGPGCNTRAAIADRNIAGTGQGFQFDRRI